MMDSISAKNCLNFRQLALKHSLNELVQKADNTIIQNFDEAITNDKFFDLDCYYVEKLMQSDNLKVEAINTVIMK